jgi:signal transduction histidine kinase
MSVRKAYSVAKVAIMSNSKNILVVDDEEQIRFCISLSLRMKGYNAICVNTAEKALQEIEQSIQVNRPFDLLICDIQMPGMTGEELIDKLQSKLIQVPFLVITGYGEKALLIRLMRKGCRDFIDKPFVPSEIEERVEMIFAEDNKVALENKRQESLARVGKRAREFVHDMNNVLCGTLGYADLALEGIPKDHPVHQYVTKISKTTSVASELCQTLLAASRCDESTAIASTEINSLVERVGAIVRDVIPSNITMEIKTNSVPVWCTLNAERIQQALLNLGLNAAQAMPDGGSLGLECAETEYDGKHIVRFTISDSGKGIPSENIKKIFQDGFTTRQDGTGMGLTTVKEIVKEHQGTIHVDSVMELGTIFIIDIPNVNK